MKQSLRKTVFLAASLLTVTETRADANFVQHLLFSSKCNAAISAAVEYSNGSLAIFREDEKAAAYAFFLGLGSNDKRGGSEKEAFGRGIGAAAFYCERNPDISIFEVGKLIGRDQ